MTGCLARFLCALGLRELDDQGRARRGTWLQCYSGQKFFPLDPRADEVHYDDLVVGLARECRFGGQIRDSHYSVAEHCVIVSAYAEREARARGWEPGEIADVAREALLHDASEAYIRDLVRPVKHLPCMRGYRRMEARIQRAVFEHFGVEPTKHTTALVKEIDDRVLVDEIEALMYDPSMYLERHAKVEGLGAEIAALPWQQAADVFGQRFAELFPEYLVGLVERGARRGVARIVLSDADANAFAAAMADPPAPSARLVDAFRKHADMFRGSPARP